MFRPLIGNEKTLPLNTGMTDAYFARKYKTLECSTHVEQKNDN